MERIKHDLLAESGEELSFETIVGSGPNGAHSHHRMSDRTIGIGDPVVLDFGVLVNGYPSDQTRKVIFGGDPPSLFIGAYEIVEAALEAGINAAKPGITANQVDRTVRSVFEEHGYGEKFIHQIGYGVGLDIHEPLILRAGMRQCSGHRWFLVLGPEPILKDSLVCALKISLW